MGSRRGFETNETILERHTTTLDAKLDGYEAILSKQKYLAGDVSGFSRRTSAGCIAHILHSSQEVTLADLFHLPYGAMVTQLGYNYLTDEAKRPNVAR